jgi:hypothetical protein
VTTHSKCCFVFSDQRGQRAAIQHRCRWLLLTRAALEAAGHRATARRQQQYRSIGRYEIFLRHDARTFRMIISHMVIWTESALIRGS